MNTAVGPNMSIMDDFYLGKYATGEAVKLSFAYRALACVRNGRLVGDDRFGWAVRD